MTPAGSYMSGRYIQRIRSSFTTKQGLSDDRTYSILLHSDGRLFVGTEKGLCVLTDDGFVPLFESQLTGAVIRLYERSDGAIVVLHGKCFYCICGDNLMLIRSFDAPAVDFCEKRGLYWFLTADELLVLDPSTNAVWIGRQLEGGKGKCLAVSDDNIYIATDSFVSAIHGKRREWKNILPAFSDMPTAAVQAMTFDDVGHLWTGSAYGGAIYDNTNLWLTPDRFCHLPRNAVRRIVFDRQGGVWFASDIGVIFLRNGKLKYFTADRWLPDNSVRDIAVSSDGETIYAATDAGVSQISSCMMTLRDKADLFEDINETYHIRRGFVCTRTLVDFNMEDGFVEITDNDGLWTACNVAAQCFRYAVTADGEALRRARRGMDALLFLTRISGIPGFTARAVRYPGDPGYGDGDHEWRAAPDGTCEWKGETSSDEMTGHFFGGSVYYDLCADETEKQEIRTALCGIMDHILQNRYRLIDHDRLPTTWACWDPVMLNNDDKWFFERGVNSLELLSFLKVCTHISGDPKYDEEYRRLIKEHHYLLNAAHHKVRDAHVCHIDDNLAFLASFTLLRLETDPAVRALILCGMEDHWLYERPERRPLFSLIHALFTGRDSDLAECVQSLREIPLDLIYYRMENSKRKDLVFDTEQAAWHEPPQLLEVLPYDECNVHRPDGNDFKPDFDGASRAQEGTLYLLPYWLGRYYGLLREADDLQ